MYGTTKLSKFDYTYNPVGTIATWTQQADSGTAVVNTLAYDNADQLTKDDLTGGTTAHNYYNYDPAGNRLLETTASTSTAGQFNNLNQLKGLTGSPTSQTVTGHTSAAVSSVSIDAVTVTPTNGTNFTANVSMPSGTNVVSVVANPSSGSPTTQRYQIVASGTAPTALSYDLNGNVITDENGNGYTWDALNRLTKITCASGATSNFAYDGLSRRIAIIEKNSSGTVTSTKNYLWIGSEIAEERDASNTVTKRFFPQGEQQVGTAYYYTRDHLGSVREMLNSSGAMVARYSYDPYGRTTLVSGSNLATKQYAGMYMHQTSGLYLTRNVLGFDSRQYDTGTGRWLSRDPIEEDGGLNLYDYVGNDPVDWIDPLGLSPCTDDCAAEARQALRDYLAEAAAIGAGLGGGAQTANKSATKPRGGVAGGGVSGDYTSFSRRWSGGKGLGRTPIPIVMVGGATVGVLTLDAIVYYYYHQCLAHCKDMCSPSSAPPAPPATPAPATP
jgi:RHS repeat-associated protein